MSVDYYNENAEAFIERTFQLDMSFLLNKFTAYVKEGGTILDIGCGSGRDSLWFKEKGFKTYAIDGSYKFIEHVQTFLGDCGACCLYNEFKPIDLFGHDIRFDGLWASASLLHVPEKELIKIIDTFMYYLKPDGVFFMSFKNYDQNFEKEHRSFTNFTSEKFLNFIEDSHFANVIEIFETKDIREDKQEESWLNVIVEKYI